MPRSRASHDLFGLNLFIEAKALRVDDGSWNELKSCDGFEDDEEDTSSYTESDSENDDDIASPYEVRFLATVSPSYVRILIWLLLILQTKVVVVNSSESTWADIPEDIDQIENYLSLLAHLPASMGYGTRQDEYEAKTPVPGAYQAEDDTDN